MTPQEIRELRLSLGLSEAEFAKKLGVAQNTISLWEKGAYSPGFISAYRLKKLAKQVHGTGGR